MWPLLAGLAERLVIGTAARTAVTSAAESGAISAGTTGGSRMLSAAQFTNAGTRLATAGGTHQTAAPAQSAPAAGDGLGWMRS